MTSSEIVTPQEKIPLIWRGIRGLCPRCGQGKLFQSYLKQNEFCPFCQEDLSRFRADDGPAWLTILLTGHLIIPVAVYFSMSEVLPQAVAIAIVLLLTILAVLVILPRTKGLFISVLWILARKKRLNAA